MKNEFPTHYKMRDTIKTKPCITGVWQLVGDRKLGAENLIGLDLFYVENQSFLLDMKIIGTTIPFVLHARNSDAILRLNFISRLFPVLLEEVTIHNRKQFNNLLMRS